MTRRLTVVVGPTGSGKTDRAIAIAKASGAEIVGADSQQVYQYFELGLAKPSSAQRTEVPHHLIDCLSPHDQCSAAAFATMADAAIAEIWSRGREVVVAGGTGLYVRALLHGLVPGPPRDPQLRMALEALAVTEGDEALHARLLRIDPRSAGSINPKDRVRTIRAIEIATALGRSPSELRAAHGFASSRYHFDFVILDPPRAALYEAIDRRSERMFSAGLIDETRDLVRRGYRDAVPMRAVGYRQALAVVEGTMGLAEARRLAAQATRNYAKRQGTWFRKEVALASSRHSSAPATDELGLGSRRLL